MISNDNEVIETRTTEGSSAEAVGNFLMFINVVGLSLCLPIFGWHEVEVGNVYRSEMKRVADPIMITLILGSGLNGMFFAYLLMKVGATLRHVEMLLEKAYPKVVAVLPPAIPED